MTAGEEPTGLGVIVGTGVGLMLSPLKNPLLPLQPFKPLIEPVAEPSLARVRVPNKVRFAAGRFDPLPRGLPMPTRSALMMVMSWGYLKVTNSGC